MARNSHPLQTQPQTLTGQPLKPVGFALASLLLGTLSWHFFRFTLQTALSWADLIPSLLGVGLIHLTLGFSLIQIVLETPLPENWQYRVGFLANIILSLVYVLLSFHVGWRSLSILGAAATGAFLGSLIISARQRGLWENNAPPSAEIQCSVLEYHQGLKLALPGSKRLFDLILAFLAILLTLPLWVLISLLIWVEDPGPILFVKNSVGLGGKNFRQFKFRTMQREAERGTGPVLAQESDQRVLRVGRVLRKTALDELPQLLNILRGEMSFVGPRPQRTVLVYQYLTSMPEYALRHQLRPGLAGLAQVAGDYYLTPRQKLRFDRLYIRYAGVGFDLKLVLLACSITFWYRWRPGWNGRLPRQFLRFASPRLTPS